MAEKKASRISRFFGFIVFRIVPVILIVGTIWLSYGLVKAVAQRVGEQVEAGQRSVLYEGTAIAILPTLTTHTPLPSATPMPSDTPTLTSTATLTPTRCAERSSHSCPGWKGRNAVTRVRAREECTGASGSIAWCPRSSTRPW